MAIEFTPETVGELHAIDGFDIVKTPSESYVIEVDFGPTNTNPGLVDTAGGEYIDALRSSVSAYSAIRAKRTIDTLDVPPGRPVRITIGDTHKSYIISPYTQIMLVATTDEGTPRLQPIIDYGDVSIGTSKITFRLAGRSEEHPDWGGVPNEKYIVVFKIVTNWNNVYWRVGFITVKPEEQ
jgi:hypothetical protein